MQLTLITASKNNEVAAPDGERLSYGSKSLLYKDADARWGSPILWWS